MMAARDDIPVKRESRMDECLRAWTLESYCTSLWGHPDKVERGGQRLWWKSPFREESSASFLVEPGKGKDRNGLWSDFGGDGGGSIFDLVMRVNKLSRFNEAFDYLLGPQAPAKTFVKRAARIIPFTTHLAPPLTLDIVKAHHARYIDAGSDYFERRGISRRPSLNNYSAWKKA